MYTLGAATTDRLSVATGSPSAFTASHSTLISCWVYPTTLTAGRFMWGVGTICGLSIDTTTSSLNLTLDTGTIDGVWTVANVLTVNTMTWICIMTSQVAAPTAAVRCWTATETTGPVERTVVNDTAPTGTWTSSGNTIQIGNRNSAAAFQGDVGGVILSCDDWGGARSVIGNQTVGTITQAEADRVKAVWCDPMWRGNIGFLAGAGRLQSPTQASTWNGFHFAASLDDPLAMYVSNTVKPAALAITGAVQSARQTPRRFENTMDNSFGPGAGSRRYAAVTA